jgi:cobalt-zinc-cadmium efflux system membrane fusion protein
MLALACACGLASATAEPTSQKSGDTVRATQDQMHQLDVVDVVNRAFRIQKSAIGQIAYNEDTSTAVLTPFSGRVTRLIAKIGDVVKAGDPLFEIDSPEIVQPQNDLVAAIAAVNKARSQLSLAQIAERRARDLYSGQAGPLKELQAAEAGLVGAQNDLRAAETALEAVRNRLRILGWSQDKVAALEQKGVIVRSTPIYAPIGGTVTARKIGPGQYVRNDSNDPLYVISNLSTVWLKAYIPETDIPYVRLGQEVEVAVLALPSRSYKARITHIDSASDANTRRVVVRSEVPNREGELKAGMFATFRIIAGPDVTAPAVPVEAVIREGDLATVWVQVEPLLFARRAVKLGIEQDGHVQIRDGLKDGERVVARGAIFIDNEWRQ